VSRGVRMMLARREFSIEDVARQLPSGGGGPGVFDTDAARRLNEARMRHLDSLGLDLAGRTVADVGCGVGNLSGFFVERGCRVFASDAREENIAELRRRHPDLPSRVLDIEVDPLAGHGMFEVVFCFGLLYHLENPLAGIRNMEAACSGLLLLETLVCDSPKPILYLVDEPAETRNQAAKGLGVRPSPAWVAMALHRCGFPYVYSTVSVPDHEDFHYEWKGSLAYSHAGHPIRCVFVGSKERLSNDRLRPLIDTPAPR